MVIYLFPITKPSDCPCIFLIPTTRSKQPATITKSSIEVTTIFKPCIIFIAATRKSSFLSANERFRICLIINNLMFKIEYIQIKVVQKANYILPLILVVLVHFQYRLNLKYCQYWIFQQGQSDMLLLLLLLQIDQVSLLFLYYCNHPKKKYNYFTYQYFATTYNVITYYNII